MCFQVQKVTEKFLKAKDMMGGGYFSPETVYWRMFFFGGGREGVNRKDVSIRPYNLFLIHPAHKIYFSPLLISPLVILSGSL